MVQSNPDTATEAVEFLAQLAGGRVQCVGLLKVLSFADHEALARYGTTIADATF